MRSPSLQPPRVFTVATIRQRDICYALYYCIETDEALFGRGDLRLITHYVGRK